MDFPDVVACQNVKCRNVILRVDAWFIQDPVDNEYWFCKFKCAEEHFNRKVAK